VPTFHELVEFVGLAIDAAGILAITLGILYSTYCFVATRADGAARVRELRHNLGTGILIGLELLIAADIIRTVAVTPTLDSVVMLGLIVLIRTFRSMTLQVELDGRWPWNRSKPDAKRSS